MEFIEIKKQNPPTDRAILISNGEIITSAIAEDWGEGEFHYYPNQFSSFDGEWNFDQKTITHWAEIPDLPKKS